MAKRKCVLVTGASGFIAKHIVLKLLNAGYDVVGSVRSLKRGDEVRAAVASHVGEGVDLDKSLRFVALDLGRDDGWDDAMQGVDILMHTASPYPLDQPKDADELIRPAVDGALRALKAAHRAGIRRAVLTSSYAAMMGSDLGAGISAHDEKNWSEMDHPVMTAYAKSKTLAERAAWDFVRDEAPEIALTTINPTLVLGPPLDSNFGTSVSLVQRLLRGTDPMLPNFGFSVVDVRDVAEMHVRVLSQTKSEGERLLATQSFVWFVDMAKILKSRFPERKIVTRQAPNFVVRLLAVFDKTIAQVIPLLGVRVEVSNARARDMLGMEFIPVATSIEATAAYLIDHDQVN